MGSIHHLIREMHRIRQSAALRNLGLLAQVRRNIN